MSSSGQDAEEAAELMATMRAEHVPMKAWYNNDDNNNLAELKTKHGDFPIFWQDLVKWNGWKEVRREFLRFTENGNGGGGQASGTDNNNNNNNNINGRKRRSRWATQGENDANQQPQTAETATASTATTGQPERKRKSRWARGRDDTPKPSTNAHAPPPPPPAMMNDPVMAALGLSGSTNPYGAPTPLGGLPGLPSQTLTDKQKTELSSLQERLRTANARLENLDAEATRIDALPRHHPERSPSPPPIYGPDGTRKNTRANRWRERYTEERHNCLERIMDLCPSMRPAGFVKRKRHRKIHIPVEDHPTYNFIGLIIGPRGKTQKEMENKTGCKIAIRGRGSVKEGAKGRLRNGAQLEGEDEPLHVVITGDDPAAIDAAAEMITSMLVVIDDEKNVHKQNQLRELALLNGTLKEEEWCHLCGEKGHKNFECPKRFALNNRNTIQIKCAICGDTSHPTRDCVMKPAGGVEGGEGDEAKNKVDAERQLDSDYSAFMAELEGRSAPVAAAAAAGDSDQLCGAVGGGAAPAPAANMGSVLTIIQPAKVVKVGESNGETAGAEVPSSSSFGVTTISPITTISSTVPNNNAIAASAVTGVTTISSTVSGVTTISPTAPTTAAPFMGVTTISSTTLPPAPTSLPPPPPGAPPPSMTAAPAVPGAPAAEGSLPFPPMPAGFPPVPSAPAPDAMTAGTGIPPPPPPPAASLPPPPPPPGAYPPYQYGAAPQQGQPWAGAQYSGYQQQQPQQWGAGYTAPAAGGEYGQGADETAGWDPRSYYGNGATGGDGGGAGGFNWWESSS